jgi:hypothetical protein
MLVGGMQTPTCVTHAPLGGELSSPRGANSGVRTLGPCTPPSAIEFMLPLSTMPDLDIEACDTPLRFCAMKNILGVASPPGVIERGIVEDLLAAMGEEPSSVDEALQVKEWHEAMKEELVSIEENKTWSLVHMPKGHHTIGLNWIFKLKRDEHNNVVRHKGRLVAKGYIQRQGIDFDKVFAPVARMESVRIVLAIATHCGWQVHHMDVKSAFLNGD